MMKKVYSPHAFRVHIDDEAEWFPTRAPEGRHFYLVTPSPHASAAKRKYLYDLVYKEAGKLPRIVTTSSRNTAKKFDNLRLAEAFADFLANPEIFTHEYEFWVVLEPPEYVEENIRAKKSFQILSEAK